MNHWSLIPEFTALLLIVVIMLFFYNKQRVRTGRRALYWACLWLSAASIVINVVCVYTIKYYEIVPVKLNIFLNTLYFWITMLMCSVVALYLFHRMLEHVYDKHCLRRAFNGVAAVMVLYTILAIWNLNRGIFFYFDEFGNYHQGPYNRLGYLGLLIEIIMLLICYVRNRKSVSKDMVKVLQLCIPLALLIGGLQVSVLRSLYLNGTIVSIINLIIFISFQSHPIEADSLTQLGTRKSFFDEITLRTNGKQQYLIINISLIHFGSVSRKLGNVTGDAILYEVGQFFAGLHPEGRAYRVSNVSFAVLLPWKEMSDQDRYIEMVIERFERPWELGNIACDLEFNGAALTYEGQSWTAEQVMAYLEYTMMQARTEEKQMVRFDYVIEKRHQRKEYLLETMQRAIEDRRFEVYYQPVFHCKENMFASAEALIRLTDYHGEVIPPGEFIPLAEESRLIDDISWIVLEKVCALMGGDGVPGLKQVSINLSVQQFLEKDIVEHIEALMKRYHTPVDALRFEITERVILEDEAQVKATMDKMKKHGFSFFLDDFGTGYANFSRVLDLPFEVIKLDRSLLEKHPDQPKAQKLPEVLVSFFHSLGHTVVVEGVETEEQMKWMTRIGADRIQGFYYARPMTEDILRAMFQEQYHEKII